MASDLKVDNLKKADGTALITAGVVQSGVTFPAGHVIQVVSTASHEANALTTSYVTYLSQAITCKGSNSDIFVQVEGGGSYNISAGIGWKILRDSTQVAITGPIDVVGPYTWFHSTDTGSIYYISPLSCLDTGNTTAAGSSVTYHWQARKRASESANLGNADNTDSRLVITLFEIAA